MEVLRGKEESTGIFFKRLIKRPNKIHTMFSHGRSHAEYIGIGKQLNLKRSETLTFSTKRFFSSSFNPWERIYSSYKTLIEAFSRFREDSNDNREETKYEVYTRLWHYLLALSKLFLILACNYRVDLWEKCLHIQYNQGWVKSSWYLFKMLGH